MEDQEEWRPVVGWEGLYEVSSWGRVRSLPRIAVRGKGTYPVRGRILKGRRDSEKRLAVMLHGPDGREEQRRIHLLVLEAWKGARPPGQEGCHNDDNQDNNHLSNLRWDTRDANERDKYINHPEYRKTYCKNGHEFTDENTIIRADNGCRQCRECQRIANRESARRRRARIPKRGHCSQCGKPRDSGIFKLCDECRARVREASRKYRESKNNPVVFEQSPSESEE